MIATRIAGTAPTRAVTRIAKYKSTAPQIWKMFHAEKNAWSFTFAEGSIHASDGDDAATDALVVKLSGPRSMTMIATTIPPIAIVGTAMFAAAAQSILNDA